MRLPGLIAASIVGASTAVFALAWAGPTPTPAPAPVAEGERLTLYRESLDLQWDEWVGQIFPDAQRPEVPVIEELPAAERDAAFGRCLEDLGFTVTDYSSGISFSPPRDADQETVTVGEFACEARFPYEGYLDYLMSEEQRSALYDYYTGYLVACLAFSGVEADAPQPTRASFIEKSVIWPIWTPYIAVWNGQTSQEQQASLERLCPSEPVWRRQMGTAVGADG